MRPPADQFAVGGAHLALVVRAADQLLDQHVLGVVGVLVLVDQHVPEPPPVVLGHRRDRPAAGTTVCMIRSSKSKAAAPLQPRLVPLVDPGDDLRLVRVRPFQRGLRVDQLVLQVRDLRGQGAGRVLLGVDVQPVRHQLGQPLRVGGVVDGEGRLHPELARPRPAGCARTSSGTSTPTSPGARLPTRSRDPLLHLPGGLVGEGDGQDLPRLRAADGQQVGDPPGQHPGLARAGTGHHQQRRAAVLDGVPLRRIETLEQLLGPLLGPLGPLPGVASTPARPGRRRRVRRRPKSAGEFEQARHDGHNATRTRRQAPPQRASRRADRRDRPVRRASETCRSTNGDDRMREPVWFYWRHVSRPDSRAAPARPEFFYGYRIPVPVAAEPPATTTPRGPQRPGAFFVPGSADRGRMRTAP